MKRFLFKIIICLAVPAVGVLTIYVITDPYKTLKPFSLAYFSYFNRDYVSSELYLSNYPKYKYDSFIFGSSRCCGLNSYQWLQYLPEGCSQFVFQAWSESITGIEQKINYIDSIGETINNAIILIDIPGTFSEDSQTPTTALCIKHPTFSGQSRFLFQAILFWDFCQKPSQWVQALKGYVSNQIPYIGFDPVSNDFDNGNKSADINCSPPKDSLKGCSTTVRRAFLRDNIAKTDCDLAIALPCITRSYMRQLNHIRSIFEKHHTSYKIVISPAYCYTFPKISQADYDILEDIFGRVNVYDYSGKNYLTEDYNNFIDPNHFGHYVGWHIIRDIYDVR